MSEDIVSAEVDYRDALIEELKQRLNVYQQQEAHLIPLPNGDLHRGFRKVDQRPDNIDPFSAVIPASEGNPLDRALAKCMANKRLDQKDLTCLWCGLSYPEMGGEAALREHLKKDHPMVVEGWDKQSDASLVMAAMADATSTKK